MRKPSLRMFAVRKNLGVSIGRVLKTRIFRLNVDNPNDVVGYEPGFLTLFLWKNPVFFCNADFLNIAPLLVDSVTPKPPAEYLIHRHNVSDAMSYQRNHPLLNRLTPVVKRTENTLQRYIQIKNCPCVSTTSFLFFALKICS